MKTMTISLAITFLLAGVLLAQQPSDIRADMLAILTGDTARFERGMQALEEMLAKNPNDPKLKVLHGTGVLSRAGQAFEKGDMQNATKLWQSSLSEMAQAVEMAPNDIFVRARRGVI